MCFLDPVRLCSPCATTTASENTFYHRHLKVILSALALGDGHLLHENYGVEMNVDHPNVVLVGLEVMHLAK